MCWCNIVPAHFLYVIQSLGGNVVRSAYGKDIIQSIGKSRKRFLAMMIITILGVAMFSGLQAACEDLRKSADRFLIYRICMICLLCLHWD